MMQDSERATNALGDAFREHLALLTDRYCLHLVLRPRTPICTRMLFSPILRCCPSPLWQLSRAEIVQVAEEQCTSEVSLSDVTDLTHVDLSNRLGVLHLDGVVVSSGSCYSTMPRQDFLTVPILPFNPLSNARPPPLESGEIRRYEAKDNGRVRKSRLVAQYKENIMS